MKETVFEMTKRRTDALRSYMQEKKIDVSFICSGPGVRYLSGFAGTPGDASLLITPEKAFIFTDSRYTIQAGEQCPYYELRSAAAWDFSAVKECLPAGNPAVGFENREISYNSFTRMKNTFGFDNFVCLETAVADLRNIKDDWELDNIRIACRIACDSIAETVPYIKDGVRELDLATELEYRMKKLGSPVPSFETIAVSGKASSVPHGVPRPVKLERGFLTIDFGATAEGYHSDMTRTFCVGKADAEQKRLYETVLAAQTAAHGAIGPGVTGDEADAVARRIIDSAGYEGKFGHSLGHGVGLLIHELPNLSPKIVGRKLVPGNVVTNEPGIYIEGKYGCRIEDMVFITENGAENLTDFPHELIEI